MTLTERAKTAYYAYLSEQAEQQREHERQAKEKLAQGRTEVLRSLLGEDVTVEPGQDTIDVGGLRFYFNNLETALLVLSCAACGRPGAAWPVYSMVDIGRVLVDPEKQELCQICSSRRSVA